jgi:hypothetical protein
MVSYCFRVMFVCPAFSSCIFLSCIFSSVLHFLHFASPVSSQRLRRMAAICAGDTSQSVILSRCFLELGKLLRSNLPGKRG